MLHFCLSQNFNFFRFKSISYIIKFKKIKGFPQKAKSFRNTATYKKTQGERVGVHQSAPPPPCTTLGIRVCVYVRTKFVLLVSFTLIKTICSKIWAKLNQCQRMQKVDVRLTCVAQKRLCLSSVMLTEDRRYSEVRGVSIQFFGDLPNIFQSP